MEENLSCNGTPLPVSRGGVIVAGVVLSSTTSLLSIIGCFLLVFTYLAYSNLRTKGRAMLVHLSIADLIIVISHIVGLWNYTKYINIKNLNERNNSNKDPICVTQGAFLVFGTVASLLWSNAIGIYMLILVVNKSARAAMIHRIFYIVSCVVCWIVPVLLVAVSAGKHYLGFHTIGSTDCYIINEPIDNNTLGYQLAEVFTYEIWVYLTFIILPILYFITFCYTKCKINKNKPGNSPNIHSTLEMKLLLVPVVFILLRIWSAVLGLFAYFIDPQGYQCKDVSIAIHLLDSVGINGQGFANAILFCILTQSVRMKLKKSFYNKIHSFSSCMKGRRHEVVGEDLLNSTSEFEELQESTASKNYQSIND